MTLSVLKDTMAAGEFISTAAIGVMNGNITVLKAEEDETKGMFIN